MLTSALRPCAVSRSAKLRMYKATLGRTYEFITGDNDIPAGIDPLFGFACVLECRRRIRLDHDDPTGQRPRCPGAGEVEDLFEPLSSDETNLAPLPSSTALVATVVPCMM